MDTCLGRDPPGSPLFKGGGGIARGDGARCAAYLERPERLKIFELQEYLRGRVVVDESDQRRAQGEFADAHAGFADLVEAYGFKGPHGGLHRSL